MKDRLRQIMEQERVSSTEFAFRIHANPSAISHLLNGRNKPGSDILANISTAFPAINIGWLLTGKGNMYHTDSVPPENVKPFNRQPALFPVEEDTLPVTATSSTEKEPDNNTQKATIPAEIVASSLHTDVKISRIILFFEDGSFEDYHPNKK